MIEKNNDLENTKKYFYLPFAALLVYTFGVFFIIGSSIGGGISLAPGGESFDDGTASITGIIIAVIVIIMLFLSVRKKRGDKNE